LVAKAGHALQIAGGGSLTDRPISVGWREREREEERNRGRDPRRRARASTQHQWVEQQQQQHEQQQLMLQHLSSSPTRQERGDDGGGEYRRRKHGNCAVGIGIGGEGYSWEGDDHDTRRRLLRMHHENATLRAQLALLQGTGDVAIDTEGGGDSTVIKSSSDLALDTSRAFSKVDHDGDREGGAPKGWVGDSDNGIQVYFPLHTSRDTC